MQTLGKSILAAAAATLVALSSVSMASARDRHHDRDDALIGGAVGLATGLIVGSAIANQPRYPAPGPVYVEPEYEYEPVPVYRAPPPPPRRVYVRNEGLEPWTPQWRRYCAYTYRSFDPRSGTYIGYDGRSHFCTVE